MTTKESDDKPISNPTVIEVDFVVAAMYCVGFFIERTVSGLVLLEIEVIAFVTVSVKLEILPTTFVPKLNVRTPPNVK